ncbi:hypothetical protein QAD02_017426 [Eretmocerus hayati]|uniref:Uncharacterized protein n=1 Tax=Eretmocerus hayati TaxID=131215 RepID=A0ACC2PGD5_9HYME|nr:hypothetical protein QAD02_017426 [Eretmocerus hayati]
MYSSCRWGREGQRKANYRAAAQYSVDRIGPPPSFILSMSLDMYRNSPIPQDITEPRYVSTGLRWIKSEPKDPLSAQLTSEQDPFMEQRHISFNRVALAQVYPILLQEPDRINEILTFLATTQNFYNTFYDVEIANTHPPLLLPSPVLQAKEQRGEAPSKREKKHSSLGKGFAGYLYRLLP